jgi:hypothetical protein
VVLSPAMRWTRPALPVYGAYSRHTPPLTIQAALASMARVVAVTDGGPRPVDQPEIRPLSARGALAADSRAIQHPHQEERRT